MSLSMKPKEDIIRKAGQLAVEYEEAYKGCAQCTFLSIADALRWGGLEIITPEMEDKLFPGLCLLSAGIGITGEGSCGAVTSGTLAVGMALDALRGMAARDMSSVGDGCEIVRREILDYFYGTYGSQRCMDIQLKRFGKAWDFRKPDMSDEFLGVTDGCAIKEASEKIVAAIMDEIVATQG